MPMKKRRTGKALTLALSVFVTVLVLLAGICYLNHSLQLKREEAIYEPMGRQVAVNGHKLNVYNEGAGAHTLVFLSGGGTCSPVLDFKSLYTCLSDDYCTVVVEKAGYGFSEDANVPRDLDTVLSETREALKLAGFAPPYVLCPHSMSGIEALYWAQQYPEEVIAIVGLDMAVPQAYENMDINIPMMRLGALAADLGLTRWIPGLSESDAIRYGTLTEEEQALYRAIFYRRTLTSPMIKEAEEIKTSAEIVQNGGAVTVPILMFASDGTGGTGYDTDTWRGFQRDFAAGQPNAVVRELDDPHYIHNHAYREIALEMKEFLAEVFQGTE